MQTRLTVSIVVVALLNLLLFVSSSPPLSPAEQEFLSIPDPTRLRAHLQHYTSIDHVAGTPNDWVLVEYTAAELRAAGVPQVEIEAFSVGLSYPVSNHLELLTPTRFVASLSEDIVPQDSTSDNWLRNHTYNGYAPSGNVTAPLVYVNYGTLSDFQYLAAQGISLKGKIALARYGNIFRGLKAYHAQEYGAIGLIIYSDPADDGFTRGAVYPDGPWRPESAVQRGGTMFISLCSGDPYMTERDPSVCGNYTAADLIPNIPILPISYGDATPLLLAISGNPSPAAWHGGLNVSYDIGPGPAVVWMNSEVELKSNVAIYDVVGTFPGTNSDEGYILLGNHRDAWVYGAADPNSGTSCLLEIARGLGQLWQKGWRPLRTIKLLSWDGEEEGLLGSTGYSERYIQSLMENAIVYINVDVAVTGEALEMSVTPSLSAFLQSLLSSVPDPKGSNTSTLAAYFDGNFDRLGSGSDYVPFLDHVGIASADLSFGGPYGVYHSVYDSFHWMTTFGDPLFIFHQAMARYWGLSAMRFANVSVLPIDYTLYSTQLQIYHQETLQLAKSVGITLDDSAVASALNSFASSASAISCYSAQLAYTPMPNPVVSALNRVLFSAERTFLLVNGLPKRPYFKHSIQAPAFDDGYGAEVFPGVKQALRETDAKTAQQQMTLLAQSIGAVAAQLIKAVPAGSGCIIGQLQTNVQ